MSETALKFGPEWLRALSHGGAVSSPPQSPGTVKFKVIYNSVNKWWEIANKRNEQCFDIMLAEYRYGREEMLVLFNKHQAPPDEIDKFSLMWVEETLEPLAFSVITDDEQITFLKEHDNSRNEKRVWQKGANSDTLPRHSGRGTSSSIGRGRGGSVDRGRGRGRGSMPYYSRTTSYDEENENRVSRDSGLSGPPYRSKGYERSQSLSERQWTNERGGASLSSGGPEDRSGAESPRKEQGRVSENWRSRGNENESSERWRGISTRSDKWSGSHGGWRERDGYSDFDQEREGHLRGGNSYKSYKPPWESDRVRGRHSGFDDEANLPEWATESTEEKRGSFDSSGAFHGSGWVDEDDDDDTVDEKSEEKVSVVDELEEEVEEDDNIEIVFGSSPRGEPEGGREDESKEEHSVEVSAEFSGIDKWHPETDGEIKIEENLEKVICTPASSELVGKTVINNDSVVSAYSLPIDTSSNLSVRNESVESEAILRSLTKNAKGIKVVAPPEDEKLDYMQSAADDLVAKLVEDDDSKAILPPPGGLLPHSECVSGTAAGADKWYYMDPQGDIQGPFTASEMVMWHKFGYFKPTLLLRRECDDKFAQLGDLTHVFGRVPFLPGPPVPPLKVSDLISAQKAQAEHERERIEQFQKQYYQQQMLNRQQEVLQQLQRMEGWDSLPAGQQHHLFLERMMSLPPISVPVMPHSLALPTGGTIMPPTTTSLGFPSRNSSGVITTGSATQAVQTCGDAISVPANTNMGHVPPKTSSQPDPIQTFLAQMQASSQGVSQQSVNNVCTALNQSNVISTSGTNSSTVGRENPLQQLLLHFNRTRSSTANSQTPISSLPVISSPISSSKPSQTENFDAIQCLVKQIAKMQHGNIDSTHQNECLKHDDEKLLKEGEEQQQHKLLEEQKKIEEKLKQQELQFTEERLRQEEGLKQLEESNKLLKDQLERFKEETLRNTAKELEEKKREAKQKLEEEERIKEKMREAKRKEEDRKKKLEAEEKKQESQELLQRQKEEEKKRNEEEKRRKEEMKRLEEERRRQEEEQKRKEEEQRQLKLQEEMRKVSLEEERRRLRLIEEEERQKQIAEERRLAHEKQKLLAEEQKRLEKQKAWNGQIGTTKKEVKDGELKPPSLAHIQKLQEEKEKEKRERELEQQKEIKRQKEAMRLAEEARQKAAAQKWASSQKAVNSSNLPIKSLLEIQAEEEKEMKKRQEKEKAERAANFGNMALTAGGVWGSAAQNLSWASRAATNSSQNSNARSGQENASLPNQGTNAPFMGGFWDPNPVKGKTTAAAVASSGKSTKKVKVNNSSNKVVSSDKPSVPNNIINKIKKKDDEAIRKKDSESAAEKFIYWCNSALIPTFVGFLADVESPYEVHDYIRSYLGDSKEVKEFARQFLEYRSQLKNAERNRGVDDNILAPAPAINPSASQEFQEAKNRLKKNKKRLQKVENTIVGYNGPSEQFSITELDYV